MLRRSIELRVDRDSVAMGDDVVSHASVLSVPRNTLLSAALELASPEIRSPGWSWVAIVDGETTAVWSVDHGVQMLAADRMLQRGPVDVHFRYFVQIDPGWLFDRLAQGAQPIRRALEEEYAPIAREKYRAELRRRERELDGRLLSTECVEALRHHGADITLHADVACEFTHDGDAWVEPLPGLELTESGGRWTSLGATVIQVRSELAARVARLAYGRSVAEVRALLET